MKKLVVCLVLMFVIFLFICIAIEKADETYNEFKEETNTRVERTIDNLINFR